MSYVTLRTLIEYYSRKHRREGKPSQVKAKKFLKRMADDWGINTPIYDEPELRKQSSQAIAIRLAVPHKHVKSRMEECFQYVKRYKRETL